MFSVVDVHRHDGVEGPLRNLEKKGYLAHDQDGRSYVYRAEIGEGEVAARTALVSAWCSATRSMPPCDPADAVMKAAMERLRFECGDLSR